MKKYVNRFINKNVYFAPYSDVTKRLNENLEEKIKIQGFIDNFKEDFNVYKESILKSDDVVIISSTNYWREIYTNLRHKKNIYVYINDKLIRLTKISYILIIFFEKFNKVFLYKINRLFIKLRNKEFNDNIIKNKKVIILGPASSSLNYMNSEEIDKFDFIIRVNQSPLTLSLYKNELGTRTDILFHNFGASNYIDENTLITQNNKYVIFPTSLPKLLGQFYKYSSKYKQTNLVMLKSKYFNNIMKEYNGLYPTTGFQALYYLLNQDFKELHITGFTFYQTSNIKEYTYSRTNKKIDDIKKFLDQEGAHKIDLELRIFKKLIRNKKNVFVDDSLKSILNK
ncbi:MAG: glycosyltransferase family 29 protein [Campylobacterales bacterium]|nr:glycosyltransferase family 29 protein [Campylobacterales bacterium]